MKKLFIVLATFIPMLAFGGFNTFPPPLAGTIYTGNNPIVVNGGVISAPGVVTNIARNLTAYVDLSATNYPGVVGDMSHPFANATNADAALLTIETPTGQTNGLIIFGVGMFGITNTIYNSAIGVDPQKTFIIGYNITNVNDQANMLFQMSGSNCVYANMSIDPGILNPGNTNWAAIGCAPGYAGTPHIRNVWSGQTISTNGIDIIFMDAPASTEITYIEDCRLHGSWDDYFQSGGTIKSRDNIFISDGKSAINGGIGNTFNLPSGNGTKLDTMGDSMFVYGTANMMCVNDGTATGASYLLMANDYMTNGSTAGTATNVSWPTSVSGASGPVVIQNCVSLPNSAIINIGRLNKAFITPFLTSTNNLVPPNSAFLQSDGTETYWSTNINGNNIFSTFVQTNFISNQLYTNLTGVKETVYSDEFIVSAALGNTGFRLLYDPAGGTAWLTNCDGVTVQVAASIIGMTNPERLTGPIPVGASYVWSNFSTVGTATLRNGFVTVP